MSQAPSDFEPETLNSREYAPRTLAAEVKLRGALPLGECLHIAQTLASALHTLHEQGLVHRDIKPSNIIFVDGVPKLADIGLVASANEARSFVGTEGFIPPEGPGTPQADLYSLGIVLYVISTGKSHRDFPEPPADLASLPDREGWLELQAIIHRAGQADPRQRYTSANAMLSDLDRMCAGSSVRRWHTAQRCWKIGICIGIVLGLVALLVVSSDFALRAMKREDPPSSNPQATKLYRQAVYLLQSETLDRLREAYTNLHQAVQLDPGFVEAYYKLFEAYFGAFGDQLPPRFDEKANITWIAEKLRQLNSNSPEYHTVNSYLKFTAWQFDEAIDEVALAIKLNPKFLRAHGLYAWYVLLARGDTATALRVYRIAEEIDPSDVIIQNNLGGPFYVERKFDAAIKQYSRAVQLEPRMTLPHMFLARTYEASKQYDRAIDEYERSELLLGADPAETKAKYERQRSWLREMGPRGWWKGRLAELNQSSDLYRQAMLHARLDEGETAIALLQQAYDKRLGRLLFLLEDDCWDPLRRDPRFQSLVRKVGLRPKTPDQR